MKYFVYLSELMLLRLARLFVSRSCKYLSTFDLMLVAITKPHDTTFPRNFVSNTIYFKLPIIEEKRKKKFFFIVLKSFNIFNRAIVNGRSFKVAQQSKTARRIAIFMVFTKCLPMCLPPINLLRPKPNTK